MAFKMKGSPMARNYGAPFKKDTEPTAEEMAKSAIDKNKGDVSRAEGRVEKNWTEGDRASSDPTGSKLASLNEDQAQFVKDGQISEKMATTVRSNQVTNSKAAAEKRALLDAKKKEAVSKVSSPTSNLLDSLDTSYRPAEPTAKQKREATVAEAKAKKGKKGKKGKK
tara:strand:- start:35 stop:535 length:501 start_codon:yes stop_codon:yes gene_type:complete